MHLQSKYYLTRSLVNTSILSEISYLWTGDWCSESACWFSYKTKIFILSKGILYILQNTQLVFNYNHSLTRSLKNNIWYVYIKCLLANIHMLWIHLNSWGQVSWFEKKSFASSSSYIMPTLQVRNLQKSLYSARRVAQTRYCTVVHGFLFNNLTSQFNSIQIFYWIKCINSII